ncbi:MAG: Holliday junction resolvase RuvX [Planctomycetota bacterium]|nr:MAG: Holliday junction resolvase RuvX [Planctomycetota bacterium]
MGTAGAALALDLGAKRCGLAVTDALRLSLQPLDTCPHGLDDPKLADALAALFDERDIRTFVLGLPLNMDGSEGPAAAAVRACGARLAARFPKVRVAYQDERLSSKEAEELLRELGLHGKKARAQRDSASAVVILRDWIRAGEP